MRRSLIVLIGAAAVALAAALPARAVDTITTFTLTGGALTITAPAGPVSLGTVATSALSVSGALGTVAVTDARGVDPASWIATVAATDFVSGSHTVPASSAAYTAGPLTTTGNPTFASLTVPSLSTTPQQVVTANPGSGNNSASWNPTIAVTLLGTGAVAGTYTATVTHSVS